MGTHVVHDAPAHRGTREVEAGRPQRHLVVQTRTSPTGNEYEAAGKSADVDLPFAGRHGWAIPTSSAGTGNNPFITTYAGNVDSNSTRRPPADVSCRSCAPAFLLPKQVGLVGVIIA